MSSFTTDGEHPERSGSHPQIFEDSSLERYFEQREGRPSSRIYRNLATDPVMRELASRKKLSYREMLIIVNGVVSALDDQISRLERFAGPWRQVSSVVNAPLFAATQSAPKNSKRDPLRADHEPENLAEARWILRHLTLRNFASVVVVVIGLAAGLFAFINKDHRSIIADSKLAVERSQDELLVANEQIRELQTQVEIKAGEALALENRLGAADDRIERLEERIAGLQRSKDEQVESKSQIQMDLTTELGDARTRIARLEESLRSQTTETEHWKNAATGFQKTADKRGGDLTAEERRSSTFRTERDQAVSAWNQLLTFLGSRKEGRVWKSLKLGDLEAHLRTLEPTTSTVDGMRLQIP